MKKENEIVAIMQPVTTKPNNDIAIQYYGESMNPVLQGGDLISLREILDYSIIPFGEIFMIVTQEMRMVYYINPSKDKSKFRLTSPNPKYEPWEISRDKILHLFVVRGSLRQIAYQ